MSPFAKSLGLVLFFSAARWSATPDQTEALRKDVLPLMRSVYLPTGEEGPVLEGIRRIMGPDWTPGEQWLLSLAAVGRDERGELA
jgi:hypothetical protein